MGLITTYKANTKTISAVRNNGTSIAYINDTLYYAKDSKNLMEITLGSVTNTTQHTLVDYGNSIGGISFKSTDEILFTESYSNFLVLGIKNNTSNILVCIIDTKTNSVLKTFNISDTTIQKVTKSESSFIVHGSSNIHTFDVIGNSVLKSFGNVHTAVIYGSEMYLTLSNAKTSIRKINLINFSGVTTLSTSNTTIFKTLTADINLITISSNNILAVLPDKFEIYKLSDATLKSTYTITLTPHTKQILVTDIYGRVYTNTQTSIIYDMNLGKEILHTSLSFISQNDLLNNKFVQVFNGGVVLQSDTQIKVLTKLTPSVTELTIPKYNVSATNTANTTKVELGRIVSYKLGIGEHKIQLKNTDSLDWQSGFDLAFNLSAGFDDELKQLDNTVEILCTLKIVVNGTNTTKSITLTNAIKNLDIMSSRYSILNYRMFDDNSQTFEQWMAGKTISFDTSQNNITFDIKVPNTIRTKRNSIVYFNILKSIQYYTAGKLIIL